MTQGKSKEEIIKSYRKANKERKTQILKKFGVSNIDRLSILLDKPTSSEVKMSKTELAALIMTNLGKIMTISFNKTVNEKDVLEQLMDVYQYTPPNKVRDSFKKCLQNGLKGQVRIATGFTNGYTTGLGKLYFCETTIERDLTKSYDNRMITFSQDSLNWVEIDKIVYRKKD